MSLSENIRSIIDGYDRRTQWGYSNIILDLVDLYKDLDYASEADRGTIRTEMESQNAKLPGSFQFPELTARETEVMVTMVSDFLPASRRWDWNMRKKMLWYVGSFKEKSSGYSSMSEDQKGIERLSAKHLVYTPRVQEALESYWT